jgi:hypothetical protein
MAMKSGAGSRDLIPPLLRDQVFRRYWGASTVSMFGDQVSSVAVPLTAVLVLHAVSYQMGVLAALEWLPSLLFALHAGAWVDRRGKRRSAMILADLGRAAAFATIPLCYKLHLLTFAQMCVVTFAAGSLSVLFTVSDGTLFMSIVKPEEYVDGQSLLYGSRALSLLSGPSVGGLLVQALSAPVAVLADVVSFLGSAVQLSSIRPVEPPADQQYGVTAGMRFIAGSPIVRASLTGVAVVNFFNVMFQALFMLYAVRMLGLTPELLGGVIGAGSIGGILGSVLCKWLTSRHGAGLVYVASCFVFTLPRALVPLAPPGHRTLGSASWCSTSAARPSSACSFPASCGLGWPAHSRRSTTAPGRPARCSAGCSAKCSACGSRCGSRCLAGSQARCCCCPRRCPGSGCRPRKPEVRPARYYGLVRGAGRERRCHSG